jgi:hypothetical protein
MKRTAVLLARLVLFGCAHLRDPVCGVRALARSGARLCTPLYASAYHQGYQPSGLTISCPLASASERKQVRKQYGASVRQPYCFDGSRRTPIGARRSG